MRIDRVRARVVRWPIASTGAARDRSERTSLVVEVRAATGEVGLGEAAPLPGMSPDTLAEAVAGIQALAARVPFVVEPTLAAVASLATAVTAAPSARFAIETAMLSVAAASQQRSLAALLTSDPASEIPCVVVVDDEHAARRAVAAGARCLKIKVGPGGDLERVIAISHAAPGLELRIDANRAWPRARVRERLWALAELPIAYVEEPCHDAHHLLAEPLPCPIALDESLATLAPSELATALAAPPGQLAALVLKPTLLGGFAACLAVAARARSAGITAVITHALEGPIGTLACAELALALGTTTPAGLAPHAALDGWPIAVTQLTSTSVRSTGTARATDVTRVAAWLGLGDPMQLDGTSEILDLPTGDERLPRSHPDDAQPRMRDLPAGEGREDGGVPGARSRTRDPGVHVLIATPSHDTIAAIHAAIAHRRALVLLHPKLPPVEQAQQRALAERARLPDDTAIVLFTSGSTGPARGVVLSRAAIEAAAAASAAHLGWRAGDRWLLALPLAHAGGLSIVIRCLLAARPIALLERDFDRAATAALLERCTLASLVPTQLAALLEDPAWRPPEALRAVLLGGAAATPPLLDAAARRGVPFLTTYGLTETFGQVATAPLDRAGDPGAPLVPLPGVEIIAGTRALPATIRIRGPMLATQYLDGAPIAPVLTTTDLGALDRGRLQVVGRADDVIITGGENVHPATVEAVLAATPGVRSGCAFAVADPYWGQVVGIAVAVDPGFDPQRAAAQWHAQLPPHARPRRLAATRTLPLLPNGKIDRRAAAALAAVPVHYRDPSTSSTSHRTR